MNVFVFYLQPEPMHCAVEKWDRQVMHNVDVARLDLAIRLLYNDKKPADLIWKITTEAYGKHRVHSGLKEANK